MKNYLKITTQERTSIFSYYDFVIPILKTYFRVLTFVDLKEIESNLKKESGFFNGLNLPELKRIKTKDNRDNSVNQNDFDAVNLEKALSAAAKIEENQFYEAFDLMYQVQDSIHYIINQMKNSPSIFRIFFLKKEDHKLTLPLKLAFIRYIYEFLLIYF